MQGGERANGKDAAEESQRMMVGAAGRPGF